MLIQISAGQGPEECRLAVTKLFHALQKEFPDITMISAKAGMRRECHESILFQTKEDLSFLEGSIQWICISPFRPKHKRKNWFVDVSVILEKESVRAEQEFRIEKFHCGGKGGQNVNKVETGVRIVHIPTGLTVSSREERSQYQNKRRAMERMQELLREHERQADAVQTCQAWQEHYRLVRGNPVRVYRGMNFQRVK